MEIEAAGGRSLKMAGVSKAETQRERARKKMKIPERGKMVLYNCLSYVLRRTLKSRTFY